MSQLTRQDATAHLPSTWLLESQRPVLDLTQESDEEEEIIRERERDREVEISSDDDDGKVGEVAGGNTTAPATPAGRGQGYCFTWNYPTVMSQPAVFTEMERVWKEFQKMGASYMVWQGEKAAREHVQGYVYAHGSFKLQDRKKVLPGAHWERAKGKPEQNKAYCTKEETRAFGPFERGEFPRPGKRSDLETVYQEVKSKGEIWSAVDKYPAIGIKYMRALERVAARYQLKRTWETTVLIFIGEPGTGKSREAREMCVREGVDYYTKSNHKWWGGYEGQHTVIWDDFEPGAVPLQYLLQLWDRYDMLVECKGGELQFRSKRVIFTTNIPFEDWYVTADRKHIDALRRRITEVREFK